MSKAVKKPALFEPVKTVKRMTVAASSPALGFSHNF